MEYISLSKAAKITGHSQEYISLLCRKKKIKGKKLGRNWVTTEEWVKEYSDKITNKRKGNLIIKNNICEIKHREFLFIGELALKSVIISFLAVIIFAFIFIHSKLYIEGKTANATYNPFSRYKANNYPYQFDNYHSIAGKPTVMGVSIENGSSKNNLDFRLRK